MRYCCCYYCNPYCITRQLIDTLLDNRENDIVHRRIMDGKNSVRQVFWLENSNGVAKLELLPMPPRAARRGRAAIALDDDTEPEDDFQDNYSNPYNASQQAGASSSSSSTAAAGGSAGSGSSIATSAVAVLAAAAAAAGPQGIDAAAGSSGHISATAPDATAASGAGGSAPKRRKIAPKAPAKGSTAAGKRKATAATATTSNATAGDSAAAAGGSADTTSRSAKAAATAAAAAAELVQPTGMIPTAAAVFASSAPGDRSSAGRLRTKRKRDAPDYQPPMQSVTEKRGQLYLSIVNKHRVISRTAASTKMAKLEAEIT
jgi:hypothetical protein